MRKKLFYHKLFQKYLMGVAISLGLASGALLGVTGLVGTYNSFSDGETLTASKLNANFNALKTAIASTVIYLPSSEATSDAVGEISICPICVVDFYEVGLVELCVIQIAEPAQL